jgi:dTDP-glucose pyrophosphorylase
MKALVLAGGRGRRLEPHSAGNNKCMLRFAGKPLVEYSLDNCLPVAPQEIVIVVGYLAEQIINHYGNEYRGVRIRYAIQMEQRGLVHALETAAPFLGTSDFMLFLADEILLEPNHFGMIDQSGRILRLVEKPRRPINRYQGTGNIVFANRILDYIAMTPISQVRNEKELPDLLQCAIDDGHVVRSFLVGGRYLNMNTPADVAEAEKALAI